MTTKKADATKRTSGTKAGAPKSMPKGGKDPKGGLTAKGRAYFAEKEGLHLRPGVQGKADTPEKKVRKGSFLRRHFANPRGPMEKDGEPTRLALSAQAWGEPLPKTMGDAKKLAGKGKELLEEYHEEKDGAAAKSKKTPAKRAVAKTSAAKRSATPKSAAKTAETSRKTGKKTESKAAAKKKGTARSGGAAAAGRGRAKAQKS